MLSVVRAFGGSVEPASARSNENAALAALFIFVKRRQHQRHIFSFADSPLALYTLLLPFLLLVIIIIAVVVLFIKPQKVRRRQQYH